MNKTLRSLAVLAALATAGVVVVSAGDVRADSATPPAAAAPAAAPAAPAAPALTGVHTYAIDAKKSLLAVQVFKEGAASGLAHDHVITASQLSGSITVDAADKAKARVEVTLPTKSLVNDEPRYRKRFGIESDISDDDRAAVLEHMQDEDQLDIAKYPTMSFTSTSATVGAGDKLTLN
ncbi:MAG TPA: YceI family protein, partial [Myxococcota bacterium]